MKKNKNETTEICTKQTEDIELYIYRSLEICHDERFKALNR